MLHWDYVRGHRSHKQQQHSTNNRQRSSRGKKLHFCEWIMPLIIANHCPNKLLICSWAMALSYSYYNKYTCQFHMFGLLIYWYPAVLMMLRGKNLALEWND
jgi:hypothetical protein